MHILENVGLAPLTTLDVGGPARYFADVQREVDIPEALRFAKRHNLPIFVLGGGSNVVIADCGWPGLLLKISINGLQVEEGQSRLTLRAGAGMQWDSLVAEAVGRGCAGVECLSGIPGTVGGTPVQNVGAYGQEVSETIAAVRAFDRESEAMVELTNEQCEFSYRSSIFNRGARNRYIIAAVSFRVAKNGAPTLKYAELQRHFAEEPHSPTLAQVRDAVRQIRHRKGMLLVEGEPDSRSAGSFFKNPVLSEEDFQDLESRAQQQGFTIPRYPALQARHKISAAWLVEHSGLHKGFRLGDAAISSKHALALINAGHASAAEIVRLKEHVQQRVREQWKIELEPEPVLVGF